MDMFTGKDNEIVMDVKDYIREQCGDEVASHIEFYINFYEKVLDRYDTLYNHLAKEPSEEAQKKLDIMFSWSIIELL